MFSKNICSIFVRATFIVFHINYEFKIFTWSVIDLLLFCPVVRNNVVSPKFSVSVSGLYPSANPSVMSLSLMFKVPHSQSKECFQIVVLCAACNCSIATIAINDILIVFIVSEDSVYCGYRRYGSRAILNSSISSFQVSSISFNDKPFSRLSLNLSVPASLSKKLVEVKKPSSDPFSLRNIFA